MSLSYHINRFFAKFRSEKKKTLLYNRCLHEMLPVRAKDAFMEILEYSDNDSGLGERLLTLPVVNVVKETLLSRGKLQEILKFNSRKPNYIPSLSALYKLAYRTDRLDQVLVDPVSCRYTLFDLMLYHMVYSEYSGYCFSQSRNHARSYITDKSMYEVYKERLRDHWDNCTETQLNMALLTYFSKRMNVPENEIVFDSFFMVFVGYHLLFIANNHRVINDEHTDALIWYNKLLTGYRQS